MSTKKTLSRKDKLKQRAQQRETRELKLKREHAKHQAEIKKLQTDRDRLMPVFEEMVARPGLTTPARIDEVVRDFCASISDQTPQFLSCEPELWSRQSMCTRTVSESVALHGGAPWTGYRIWYNGRDYIEAERHVVWRDGDRVRDVSFSADGEAQTLFLPDHPDRQGFDDNAPRYQHATGALPQEALAWHQAMWRLATAHMTQSSEDEGWERMPTYEQWLAGKRASNFEFV